MEPSGRRDQPGSWERGTGEEEGFGKGGVRWEWPYLVQLQRAPIPRPGDGEQGGVGSGGAADHAPHALGQVGLREHGGHLCWVCGDTRGWGPHGAPLFPPQPPQRGPLWPGGAGGGLTEHCDKGRGRRRLPEPVTGGAGVFPSVVWGRLLQQEAPIHQDTDPSLEVAGKGWDSSEWHSWDHPCCTGVMDLPPPHTQPVPGTRGQVWGAQQPPCHPHFCRT